MPRLMYLLLVLLSLIWGGSFLFMKLLLADFGPWSIAFLRSVFGLAAITVVMVVCRKPFGFRKLPWLPLIVIGLLNTTVPWGLIAFSETRISSSLASVLNATTPLWTLFFGLTLFGVKSTRTQWLGMIAGLLGIMVLLDVNPVNIISVDPTGFLGMVTATLCYGLSAYLLKRFVSGITMYQSSFATLLVCMAGSSIPAFFLERITFAPLASFDTILILVGLGVFGSGIAYIIYYYLIQKASPEFASMVTYLVPVSAILWGYTFLHEEIHWNLVGGLLFILGGVYLANRKPKQATTVQTRQAG